jgi:radical SAM superfamily enzyme YgiQ (UPF0313 family)
MKLGLIAMSGVRAHNPELTALGLTLPGFVERNKVIASLPSLGLLTLAGLTPPSVDTHYLEVPDIAALDGVPAEFDVVAISSFSAQISEAYVLADRYRALGTTVILGGLHVSALPDEARAHADAIVVGEGESAWPALVADLLHSGATLRPVYDARRCNFDLARSPMPRFDLLNIPNYNRLTVHPGVCLFRPRSRGDSQLHIRSLPWRQRLSPVPNRNPPKNICLAMASIPRCRTTFPSFSWACKA